jgi:UDP-glucose 4-epimerase
MGTLSVLEACRLARVARLVYVSSAEVYGRSAEARVPESGPLRPRSPYGAAKAAAEQFVRAYAEAFGLQAVILRPFSVYGPGQRPQSLVGTVIDQAQRAGAVVVADLRPTRDYCFVDDVAEGIARACTADLRSPCVLNLGTGRATSVAELARLVLAILRADGEVRGQGPGDRPRDADIPHLVADTSLARTALGWEARTALETGLERTIRWAAQAR